MMELTSKKNKSVYNVPEEMAPDRASFVTYCGEFWKKNDQGAWDQIEESDIPAGSNVYALASTDMEKTTVNEEADENVGLDNEGEGEGTGTDEDGLVKTGVGNIGAFPGVVGAESQESIDAGKTSALPHSGEAHGDDAENDDAENEA